MGLKIELVQDHNWIEIVKDGELLGVIRVDPRSKFKYAKLELEFKKGYKINRSRNKEKENEIYNTLQKEHSRQN